MCGRLVNLDTVARVLAEYYHLKTDTQLAALNDALGRVPAETVGKELFGISEQLNDTISRAAVVDEIEGVDWYHINKHGEMVHGANSAEHQAWYKADDIYAAIERVPSTQPVAKDINVPVKDCISRQAAIDALCDEYCGWWQDCKYYPKCENLKAIQNLPSAQPERTCVNCGRTVNNGGWYADGGTRCPIEEHYALPKDGYCHLWEKRNVTDDDYPERRTDE